MELRPAIDSEVGAYISPDRICDVRELLFRFKFHFNKIFECFSNFDRALSIRNCGQLFEQALQVLVDLHTDLHHIVGSGILFQIEIRDELLGRLLSGVLKESVQDTGGPLRLVDGESAVEARLMIGHVAQEHFGARISGAVTQLPVQSSSLLVKAANIVEHVSDTFERLHDATSISTPEG